MKLTLFVPDRLPTQKHESLDDVQSFAFCGKMSQAGNVISLQTLCCIVLPVMTTRVMTVQVLELLSVFTLARPVALSALG